MIDYKKIYATFWKDLVEYRDGSLNKDKVMRELHDYSILMESASKVYCTITSGMISKTNTLPEVVLSIYEENIQNQIEMALDDHHKEFICKCGEYNAPKNL